MIETMAAESLRRLIKQPGKSVRQSGPSFVGLGLRAYFVLPVIVMNLVVKRTKARAGHGFMRTFYTRENGSLEAEKLRLPRSSSGRRDLGRRYQISLSLKARMWMKDSWRLLRREGKYEDLEGPAVNQIAACRR